ncbi:MAG: DUF3788 family protein [Desulfobacter sp.]
METINTIELADETVFPDEDVLKKVLGRSFNAYLALLKRYDDNGLIYEWRYYRDGKAWLCKVRKKKRTIVWMSAWKGYMQATIYVPEKYIEDIYRLRISDKTKDRIRNTRNVGKSKPCIFDIRNKKILNTFEKVMAFKILAK